MNTPLVTVICICYNHAQYVIEALNSVAGQTYNNIELIVIDDGSTDGSGKVIKQWIANHPSTTMILNARNLGYCKSFNKAYSISKGAFYIDLAADDILLANRIELGLKALIDAGPAYGVNFSDAEHVNDQGNFIRLHSEKYPHRTIPSGDVYRHIIERYFICSPTMMFKREVIEQLNGYDETLAYEDFDFWVRASRRTKFIYTPQVLLKKRDLPSSMSKNQFNRSSIQRLSTFLVCKKIKELNETPDEIKALKRRVMYELKVSLKLRDFKMGLAYLRLLTSL